MTTLTTAQEGALGRLAAAGDWTTASTTWLPNVRTGEALLRLGVVEREERAIYRSHLTRTVYRITPEGRRLLAELVARRALAAAARRGERFSLRALAIRREARLREARR